MLSMLGGAVSKNLIILGLTKVLERKVGQFLECDSTGMAGSSVAFGVVGYGVRFLLTASIC